MNKADRAEELFRKGYNCSQSVFVAFAEELGMSEEEAARMASPFGAGFGKLREVCGAVSGMTMAAGVLRGYSDPADAQGKKALYALVQKMCREFEEKEGSLICRELLGLKKGQDLDGAGGENRGVLPEPPLRGRLPHCGGNRREIFAEREWLRYKKLI